MIKHLRLQLLFGLFVGVWSASLSLGLISIDLINHTADPAIYIMLWLLIFSVAFIFGLIVART